MSQFAPSPDARFLAYAVAEGGADWETVRIRSVAGGQDLADSVAWVRFSDLSWTRDSKGFFYSRYPEPPKNKVLEAALSGQAIYYHRLGTPQSEDLLIYQRLDHPAWIVNATVSDDGRYLFIRTYRGADNNNQLHYMDLEHPGTPNVAAVIRPIVETLDAEYTPIGNYQSRLYLRCDKDAPNRRIIAIDLEHPDPREWKVVVPEQPHAIEHAALIGGRIVMHTLERCAEPAHDVHARRACRWRHRAAGRWRDLGPLRAGRSIRDLVFVQLAAVAGHGLPLRSRNRRPHGL